MKQEINCARCAKVWRDIASTPDPEAVAAGEAVTVVAGLALHHYCCDGCGEDIAQGADCHAVGVTAGGQVAPPNWEREFIKVAP